MRHWIRFIEITHGVNQANAVAFPANLLDVLAWSNTFRCLGTFANYLGHLRCACHALGLDAPPVGHQTIKRAMAGIVKRQLHDPRPKVFITKCVPCCGAALAAFGGCVYALVRSIVTNMVRAVQRELEEQSFAMLWLVSYLFLRRLPSEARFCLALLWFLTRLFTCTGPADLQSKSRHPRCHRGAVYHLAAGRCCMPSNKAQKE